MMNECFTVARVGSARSQCPLSVSHRQPSQHITGPACVVLSICGLGLIVEKVERYESYGFYDDTRYWLGWNTLEVEFR